MVSFAGVKPYELRDVEVTDTKIGVGAYATVHELRYMGLKCAGKRLHQVLSTVNVSYTLHRFEEECHLLSQVRHPNIVQFLGVFFQVGDQVPTLVMEFLPTNLTSCIDQYGILPKEISYSILHDVALGLCYLHNQTPPIIHRDLSSNNVLLTSNMTAKISDLGMARMINLTPLQVSRMTETPGTPHFMPPEVMVPNPQYDTTIDIFSYGILMIHIFSGRWPEPQLGPSRIEAGVLIPVTEAERREVFLQAIGDDHPLMDIMLRCVNNDPIMRPPACEIVKRLAEMVPKTSLGSFTNTLTMLKDTESSTDFANKASHKVTNERPDYGQALGEQQSKLIIKDLQTKVNLMENEKRAHEAERNAARSEMDSLSEQIKKLQDTLDDANHRFEKSVAQEQDKYKTKVSTELKQKLKEEKQQHEKTLQQERQKYEQLLEENKKTSAHEREKVEAMAKLCDELEMKTSMLQAQMVSSTVKIELLQSAKTTLEEKLASLNSVISSKDSEIDMKSRSLHEKDATISEMNELLDKTRAYLSNKQQSLQASITWKKCADLPIAMYNGRTEIIHGKVYFRGMTLTDDDDDDDNILLCYDMSHDSWTVLPPLPVKWFGLGQVDGKLVVVGGLKKDDRATNNVYTLNIVQKWKPTLPQMPTARCLPAVVTLQTVLVVAGGLTGGKLGKEKETDAVEIYNFSYSQWYSTNPLPRPCIDVSLAAIDDACYVLGGYQYPFRLNQALCASIGDLLRNAVPAQRMHSTGSSSNGISDTDAIHTQSVWKNLPNTPTYRPAAAVLAGSLLAIGGGESSIGEADKKEIYMFSPSTNSWIQVSNLPAPRSRTITAMLSSTEILVIGGMENWEGVNTVYKGTLRING